MRRVLVFVIVFVLITTGVAASNTLYDPQDKQEYIFGTHESKYGYLFNSVYSSLEDAERYQNDVSLPISVYSFKKLYIDSILKEDGAYTYYSIVIEPGEKYVYKCYGSVDKSTFSDFRKYEDYITYSARIQNKEPLYEGSAIQVVDGEFSNYTEKYFFNNGGSLYKSEWDDVKTILDYLQPTTQSKKEKVADLFTKSSLVYDVDDFDEIAFIKIGGTSEWKANNPLDSKFIYPPIQLYIGIQSGRVWSRLKAVYQGSDWLFADSITLGADKDKWDSGPVDFERETEKGGIRETMDIPATEIIILFMEKFCEAKEYRIRFRGDSKYADVVPRDKFMTAQRSIIELYRAMTE